MSKFINFCLIFNENLCPAMLNIRKYFFPKHLWVEFSSDLLVINTNKIYYVTTCTHKDESFLMNK